MSAVVISLRGAAEAAALALDRVAEGEEPDDAAPTSAGAEERAYALRVARRTRAPRDLAEPSRKWLRSRP